MGLFFDEFQNGLEWPLGTYDFTRENVLRFARAYDPQVFHVDDKAAAESHFGKLAASGWHTAAGWMRCFVETNRRERDGRVAKGEPLPGIGPSPGFADLKWIKPVYPGDSVAFATKFTGKRELSSRPQWGLVFKHNEGFNQHGDLVFSFDGKVLVQRR